MKLLNDFSNRFKDRTIVPLYYKKISPPPCGRIAVYGGVAILQAMEGGGGLIILSPYMRHHQGIIYSLIYHLICFIFYCLSSILLTIRLALSFRFT